MMTAKQVRLDLKITQTALAQTLGVSQGMLSLWESGSRIPCADNAVRLVLTLADLALAAGRPDLLRELLGEDAGILAPTTWFPIPETAEGIEAAF